MCGARVEISYSIPHSVLLVYCLTYSVRVRVRVGIS